jgi:hypothetical protein
MDLSPDDFFINYLCWRLHEEERQRQEEALMAEMEAKAKMREIPSGE